MAIQPRVNQNIGQTGGLNQVPLNASQLPAHIHEIPATPVDNSTANGTVTQSTGRMLPVTTEMRGLSIVAKDTFTNSTGLSLPIDTYPPWQTINYIISTFGFVSSRARGRQLAGVDYVGRIVPVSRKAVGDSDTF